MDTKNIVIGAWFVGLAVVNVALGGCGSGYYDTGSDDTGSGCSSDFYEWGESDGEMCFEDDGLTDVVAKECGSDKACIDCAIDAYRDGNNDGRSLSGC